MRPPRLNFQQIISFYFVAKEGNFDQAAESLFITPSAVAQQIKSLEVQFGTKLFRVKKHKVYLTAAGERLFAYAEEFIGHVTTMESFLRTYRNTTLHIGIATALMFYMMPVMDKFKELYPSVQISLREGTSVDLVSELLKFRHDICFVGQVVKPSSYPTGRVTGYRIPEVEKMVFVVGPEYSLATNIESKWEDLAREPLIIQSEGSSARLVALSHFQKRGLNPIIGTEVDNIEAAKGLARQNKGIALMFWPNVRDDVNAGKLRVIPVSGGDIRLGIDTLLNSEIASSPPARDFIGLVKAFFGEIQPLGVEGQAGPYPKDA
jgi:LysR family transcriptional regulator, low CO2-responsive transcriptional regulator